MRPEIYKKFDDLDSQLADMTTNQGDITQLNTTDKSSVVNAIKEVKTATNSILSKMVDWINVKSAP
jgi:hypothetical protein